MKLFGITSIRKEKWDPSCSLYVGYVKTMVPPDEIADSSILIPKKMFHKIHTFFIYIYITFKRTFKK